MRFKIQYLQAAVALVLASLQPQPETVVSQPMIVERVYKMGTKVNKSDISELTAALNDAAEELRHSRAELDRYAESDFNAASKLARELQSQTVYIAGLAESFILMLPEKEIIMSYDKNSTEFAFIKSIKMIGIAAKNYLNTINQLIHKTDVRESGIDTDAIQHLLEAGNKAAKWL